MLLELSVADFALVERLRFRLHRGLNVFTGETGAGKSLLIEALGLALGERLEPEHLRKGAAEGWVEARFDIAALPLPAALVEEIGLRWPEDGELVIRREILPGGRGRARVNDRSVTTGYLRRLGSWLVDLHGQHEHQWLLDPARQLGYVDRFGSLGPQVERVAAAFALYRQADQALSELERALAARAGEEELRRFQLAELRDARLRPGEEAELDEERQRLVHAEKLGELVRESYQLLEGGEACAQDRLGAAERLVARAAELDPTLAALAESLRGLTDGLADAAEECRRYGDRLESDPDRLVAVEERRAFLERLRRKHGGGSEEALLARMKELEEEAALGEHGEERRREAERRRGEAARTLWERARELSLARQKAAAELARVAERELAEVGLRGAGLRLELTPLSEADEPQEALDRVGAEGGDRVEILFAPNVGEEHLPLRRIASGGELSRVMLALKSVLAGADQVGTLVFDEIDLGIGGDAAAAVGDKMKRVGKERQVLCITHLPQLAARGDHHFQVAKKVAHGRTVIMVQEVAGEERVEELARMLAGKQRTESARRHAEELLAGGARAPRETFDRPRGRS